MHFAGGLRWAIQKGMQVIKFSLCASRDECYGHPHVNLTPQSGRNLAS